MFNAAWYFFQEFTGNRPFDGVNTEKRLGGYRTLGFAKLPDTHWSALGSKTEIASKYAPSVKQLLLTIRATAIT